MAVRESKPVKGSDSCNDRRIEPLSPPRPLKGSTLPLEQLWTLGLDKAVHLDVLRILSRLAARPATTNTESLPDQSAAPAIARATRLGAAKPKNAARRENADD